MMQSKTKAQRDAVIATGLMPVSFAIDVLATVIWPFDGLLEIDSVSLNPPTIWSVRNTRIRSMRIA